MAWPFPIFSLFLLCFTVGSQSSTEILTVYDPKSTVNVNEAPLAVSLAAQDLNKVASSVLMAETWLRTHVLAYYPAFITTHIVVGHHLLCFSQTQQFDLILPALKNLYHSLTRWGLEREIKVSPSLSSHCLNSSFGHSLINPLLNFIQATNSTYLVNPLEPISEKIESLVLPHVETLKKHGFLAVEKVSLLIKTPNEINVNPTMRKLSSLSPLPPLIGSTTSPPPSPPAPHHHHHHHLPPCNPWVVAPPQSAPGPAVWVAEEKLWCVAKPSVPAETLKEAIDYACGEGGAECDEIQPNGSCFYPDSDVAHASFAFNSYWQKNKRDGGTCSFGGTAMIINSDPSFLDCRFIVS